MMNHATFKASLFMAAGIIDHETGTRDIRRLDGLYRCMPITGTLAIVASAAMAGVPLLNGFLSKEMFFAETVFVSAHPWVEAGLPLAATLAGVFAVVYSLRFGHDVFFGPPPRDLPRQPHEPPRWMRVPVELLVLACLVVGIVPAWSVGPLLAAAARPVVGGTLPEYSLAVWHGFNAPLLMSLRRAGRRHRRLPAASPRASSSARSRHAPLLARLDGKRLFERALAVRDGAGAAPRCALAARGACSRSCSGCWCIAGVGRRSARRCRAARLGRPRARAGLAGVRAAVADRRRCAVGAAWQAKFHRLAALTMLAVAGLVDLPHLRLVLGARPGAHAARGRGRDHRAVPARPALAAEARRRRTTRAPRRARALAARAATSCSPCCAGGRPGGAVVRHADAPGAAEHLAVLPRAARCPKAAAPTSST